MKKTCTKCGKTFPANTQYFHKHHIQSSGLHPRCKTCRSQERKEHHVLNGEKAREQMRQYSKDHSSKAVERATQWKIDNPLKHKANSKKYRQNHKEQGRVHVTNRQARLANAEGTHTAEDINMLYEKQCGKCAYCGVPVGSIYDVDHVIPISRGGSNYPDNLAIACPLCNRSKGSKLLSEWID